MPMADTEAVRNQSVMDWAKYNLKWMMRFPNDYKYDGCTRDSTVSCRWIQDSRGTSPREPDERRVPKSIGSLLGDFNVTR